MRTGKQGRVRERPSWWMCRNCCALGHDAEACTADTQPDNEKLFLEYTQSYKASQNKTRQRQKAHERNINDQDAKPITVAVLLAAIKATTTRQTPAKDSRSRARSGRSCCSTTSFTMVVDARARVAQPAVGAAAARYLQAALRQGLQYLDRARLASAIGGQVCSR